MSDYNKRLLGISVGAIFYIIFFLLNWSDLVDFEINFERDRSLLFDAFGDYRLSRDDKIDMLWYTLSIICIGGFWFFRDAVGNYFYSIFQWIKGKI